MERDGEEGFPCHMLSAREVTQDFVPMMWCLGIQYGAHLALVSDQRREVDPSKNRLDYVDGFRH